ncbi:MAG: M23 family peptidase, partial [Clostridiales bacterium]
MLVFLFLLASFYYFYRQEAFVSQQTVFCGQGEDGRDYIKWVDFNVPYNLLERAADLDIDSYDKDVHLNWLELLAYVAAKKGGDFDKSSLQLMDKLAEELAGGGDLLKLTEDMKYYPYYLQAYTAVLAGFLGECLKEVADPQDPQKKIIEYDYGLRAFSPIAQGYGYGHYDDFGNARDYGYKRKHLGNDLLG